MYLTTVGCIGGMYGQIEVRFIQLTAADTINWLVFTIFLFRLSSQYIVIILTAADTINWLMVATPFPLRLPF